MLRKMTRRIRKYRLENQPRYPGLFSTLDLTLFALQTLAVVAVFIFIFNTAA